MTEKIQYFWYGLRVSRQEYYLYWHNARREYYRLRRNAKLKAFRERIGDVKYRLLMRRRQKRDREWYKEFKEHEAKVARRAYLDGLPHNNSLRAGGPATSNTVSLAAWKVEEVEVESTRRAVSPEEVALSLVAESDLEDLPITSVFWHQLMPNG